MKIVIVSPAYPLRGGIANFTAQLYQELSKDNEVIIFTFKRQYPKIFFPGKTQFESREEVNKVPTRVEIDSINPFNWKRIATSISSTKPDLVIFQYWLPFFSPGYSSIAKRIRRNSNVKLIAICHNIIPHEKRTGDNFLTNLFLKKMDYFILLSKEVEKDLFKFIANPKFKVLPHPVYSSFGESVENKTAIEYLKLDDDNYILFFGFIRDYKGLDVLIEAMSLLKDTLKVKLIVAGEFYEDEKKYLDLIKKFDLKDKIILFNNFIPATDVKYYFSASDLVVLPYKDATQSGIVQIAVNFSKPVIASDVGGISEVIKNNESGYIVKKENPKELAEAISKFYNGNKGIEFSNNIAKIKDKYSWTNFVDGIIDLIKM